MPETNVELARCDDCGASPTMTIAFEDNEPVAVLACDCARLVVLDGFTVESLPFRWK